MQKEVAPLVSIFHIVYFEFLQYNVLDRVGNICLQTFLKKNCFYCYCQQIISVVAIESLIVFNLRAPGTQKRQYCNTKYHPKPNQARDAFPAAKIRKKGFRKVFNVWTKLHFSNFEEG